MAVGVALVLTGTDFLAGTFLTAALGTAFVSVADTARVFLAAAFGLGEIFVVVVPVLAGLDFFAVTMGFSLGSN
ncbi:hypothetical protein [Rhodoferax sp.]|uniref:hypothetical protein n=1 Tax=Rhodoferax sp. TaxID=50421 RepID=UPI0025F37014|nr:hypothetical protein [Rhodoferax sp.]